jgi:hypothetical protein
MIEIATERVCKSNEIRSVCNQCIYVTDAKTKRTTLNCTGCNTFPTDSQVVIIRSQSYQNVSEANCLCRNESARTNCTCCQAAAVVPLLPIAPTCSTGSVIVSNTRCEHFENNTTSRCNITRREGAIETYFNNINQTDLQQCNCFVITNNTQTYRQCQCCAAPLRLSPAAPNCSAVIEPTTESCTCLPVRSNNTNRFNCDCNVKGIQIIRDINLADNQCGCLQSNTVAKQCSCCVSGRLVRDKIAPASCE